MRSHRTEPELLAHIFNRLSDFHTGLAPASIATSSYQSQQRPDLHEHV